jgi:hypothetical protein
MVSFDAGIFGNHREPPLHGGIQPLEKSGGRDASVAVRPHPGWGRILGGPVCDHLHVVGSWVGLDPSHISASTRMWCVDGLILSSPLRISKICVLLCAFCLVLCIFHLFSETCPEKRIFLNTSWTRSIVYAYVSKFAYFSDFGLKLVVLNMH